MNERRNGRGREGCALLMSAIIGFGHETKYFVQLMIAAFFLFFLFYSCKVFLDVTIRIVHARSSTEIRDIPCFMKIRGNHNHPLDTADVLNQLRVSPCTRDIFESYFRQGIYMKCYIHMHKPFNLKDFFLQSQLQFLQLYVLWVLYSFQRKSCQLFFGEHYIP